MSTLRALHSNTLGREERGGRQTGVKGEVEEGEKEGGEIKERE